MKKTAYVSLCLAALSLAGCANWAARSDMHRRQLPEERRDSNVMMAKDLQDDQIRNGIIAQSTLYPYHFVSNTAVLNPLGERDLQFLADYYKSHEGVLSIRRKGATPDLYADRLAAVTDFLAKEGVDTNRVRLEDQPAAGDGMASEQIVKILTEDKDITSDEGGAGGLGALLGGGGN
ncbi:MAG: hypothetical protein KJ052_09795 [Candidatus Hydrogenedentes bacterium]|nr:hypothetical protein [Candidatus Hydrogenedentota bacterium]